MEEREKLLHARAEVIEVLTRYGLIGHFALCGQGGKVEAVMHVTAPWSGLSLEEHEDGKALRLRSRRQDYLGNPSKQKQDLASTLAAASSLGMLLGSAAMGLLEASKAFDDEAGGEHTPLVPDPGGMQ